MPEKFGSQGIVTEYAQTLIRVKAKQLVRRPGFCRSDQEDIEQELVISLLAQAGNYNPDRSALNTFIARVVDSAIAMLVRERGRAKRSPADDIDVQSLADSVPQKDGPPESLAKLISQVDLERRTGTSSLSDTELFELVEDVAGAIASLPPDLQDACRSLMERNRQETEAELGISRRQLRRAIEAVREHFEKSGLAKS